MKNKIFLLKLPFIIFFSFAYWITHMGEEGQLNNEFLRDEVFPALRAVSGTFTNAKFKIRGPIPPKSKIVIAEVDSPSIEAIGRWPWHRDATAYLIEKVFESGAKVVGLDMVFSETDRRVPEELGQYLAANNMDGIADQFETDPLLRQVIEKYPEQLVLGWTTENACQPAYSAYENCPVTEADYLATHPKNYEKFSIQNFNVAESFNPQQTPLMSVVTFIANIDMYNEAARHAGSFNAFPDADSYIRRTPLIYLADGKAYPSLALEMATVGMNEEVSVNLDKKARIDEIRFTRQNRAIPITPLGTMEINFRGPSFTYTYVSALDIMGEADEIHTGHDRSIAASKAEVFKDAYVLIGVSALGVFDMRAFPYDQITPGVEGHANILDNILNADYLIPGTSGTGSLWILLIMSVGALLFAYFSGKLEAVPALLLFLFMMGGMGLADQKILFESHNINWNTSLLYIEFFTIFIFSIAIKYVMEERNKKFIKGAFAKYVAPAIVDSIIKDPTKLTVGGEKRELTILFSDIRSFTTMSEKMDAKQLASFLNHYLGHMTDIVFNNNGTLDKYIGDAVMAFWGAPLELKSHAKDSCTAAIKMFQKLDEIQPEFKKEYGLDVAIGIGINSGHVNVGNMGSSSIFEYTVIGDSVNLASRLEGLTKYYGADIVTSRFTMDCIDNNGDEKPPHRTLDFVKVKGKKKAIELIEVIHRNLDQEGLKMFEDARQLYSQQKWDEAIAKFNDANAKLRVGEKDDGPSKMYLERCEFFKKEPPGDAWDGAWTMTSK